MTARLKHSEPKCMQTQLTLPDCLTQKNASTTLFEFNNQTTIYHQGEVLNHVWIIKHGFIKIHRLSAQGKQATLSLLGRDAIFGAIESHHGTVNETACTQSTAQVYRLSISQFDSLLVNHTDFSQFVAWSLYRRKEALQRRLFCIMQRKVAARIAALLTDLAQNEGERCIHGGEIDVYLSQQDIADMIGASRQVVSSELNRLREQDIVHYSRNLICVIDLATLAFLAEN